METATVEVSDVNLGLYDGEVSHERINAAVARGRKTVLFGDHVTGSLEILSLLKKVLSS